MSANSTRTLSCEVCSYVNIVCWNKTHGNTIILLDSSQIPPTLVVMNKTYTNTEVRVAAATTNPMQIGFAVWFMVLGDRNVVVDNHCGSCDIDATGKHVSI